MDALRTIPVKADACRQPGPGLLSRPSPGSLRPHDTYLTQAPEPEPDIIYSRRQFQQRLQESLNRACQSDPTAAELNGHFQVGPAGEWVKSGPSVVELAAGFMPLPRAVDLTITGVKAGIGIHKFLADKK